MALPAIMWLRARHLLRQLAYDSRLLASRSKRLADQHEQKRLALCSLRTGLMQRVDTEDWPASPQRYTPEYLVATVLSEWDRDRAALRRADMLAGIRAVTGPVRRED